MVISDVIHLVLTAIALIFGGLYLHSSSQGRAAEAELAEKKSKEQVQALQSQVTSNDSAIQAEEQKRAELLEAQKKEQEKSVNEKDVEDFFNNRPKP